MGSAYLVCEDGVTGKHPEEGAVADDAVRASVLHRDHQGDQQLVLLGHVTPVRHQHVVVAEERVERLGMV